MRAIGVDNKPVHDNTARQRNGHVFAGELVLAACAQIVVEHGPQRLFVAHVAAKFHANIGRYPWGNRREANHLTRRAILAAVDHQPTICGGDHGVSGHRVVHQSLLRNHNARLQCHKLRHDDLAIEFHRCIRTGELVDSGFACIGV